MEEKEGYGCPFHPGKMCTGRCPLHNIVKPLAILTNLNMKHKLEAGKDPVITKFIAALNYQRRAKYIVKDMGMKEEDCK